MPLISDSGVMMSEQAFAPNPAALITANRTDLAALIAKALQRQQWRTVIVNEACEIVEHLNCHQFQLLILDLDWLSEIGLGLLAQLQQTNCTTTILIMTSYEDLGDRARQIFGTRLTVLIKPFRIQDIVQQIFRVSRQTPMS